MENAVQTEQEVFESALTEKLLNKHCVVERHDSVTASLHIDLQGLLEGYDEGDHDQVIQHVFELPANQYAEVMTKRGIKNGVNESLISGMLENKLFDQPMVVAKGTLAVDGVDGYIVEHFEREREIKPQVLENGDTDHKELGIILDVEKGTIIADIFAPTEPVSGLGVSGEELKGRQGKPASVPMGENTSITADGKHLVASTCGNLVFKNGKFNVEQSVTINGNVDSAIGNIEFSGDIIINGDVYFGYTVSSKKSIKISGSVEGANLFADGSIVVGYGINGQQKGTVSAKGDITAMFIENCEMYSEGTISAQVIVNCHASAEKEILVTSGKGVITGGEVTAVKKIEAKVVGAEINIPTTLRLGMTHRLIQTIQDLEKNIKEIVEEDELIAKNIQYLELLETRGEITSDRKELLLKLRTKKPTMKMMLKRLQATLAQKVESAHNVGFCRIEISQTLHPPVRVHFGSVAARTIEETYGKCSISLGEDGEVKVGM